METCLYLRHILVTIWTSDQVLDTIWAHFGHILVVYVTKMCPYLHCSGAPRYPTPENINGGTTSARQTFPILTRYHRTFAWIYREAFIRPTRSLHALVRVSEEEGERESSQLASVAPAPSLLFECAPLTPNGLGNHP